MVYHKCRGRIALIGGDGRVRGWWRRRGWWQRRTVLDGTTQDGREMARRREAKQPGQHKEQLQWMRMGTGPTGPGIARVNCHDWECGEIAGKLARSEASIKAQARARFNSAGSAIVTFNTYRARRCAVWHSAPVCVSISSGLSVASACPCASRHQSRCNHAVAR